MHEEEEAEEIQESLEYSYGDSIPDELSGHDAGFDDDDSLELP